MTTAGSDSLLLLHAPSSLPVLYLTSSGESSGDLASLFYCAGCRRVLGRDPEDVLEELASFYCPFTLENLPSSEALAFEGRSTRIYGCPSCRNVLSTMATSAAALERAGAIAKGPPADPNDVRYYFACGYCHWDSLDVDLCEGTPEGLVQLALERERALPAKAAIDSLVAGFEAKIALRTPKRNVLGRGITRQARALETFPWRWEDAERRVQESAASSALARSSGRGEWNDSLLRSSSDASGVDEPSPAEQTAASVRLRYPASQPRSRAELMPTRVTLRTKRSVRCRRCFTAGDANILVKSNINPLKGDTSMRTQVGSWFKKRSSAWDTVPHVAAHRRGATELVLTIRNPSDVELSCVLSSQQLRLCASPVWLDAFDELDAQDTQEQALRPDDPEEWILARGHAVVAMRAVQIDVAAPEAEIELATTEEPPRSFTVRIELANC